MTNLIDQLEAAAKAATPGPWKRDNYDRPNMQIIANGNEVIVFHHSHERQEAARVVPNHQYIALANPDTILKLIAVVRAAEELSDLLDSFDIPELRDALENLK